MALLPSFRRLFSGDFKPELKDFVDTLGSTLNNSIEAIYNAMNRNISLTDNIRCTIRDITVRVGDNGIPNPPVTLTVDFSGKALGLTVLNASNTDNPNVYPSAGVFLNFSQLDTRININHITGLQSNTSYTLKVVAWGT